MNDFLLSFYLKFEVYSDVHECFYKTIGKFHQIGKHSYGSQGPHV